MFESRLKRSDSLNGIKAAINEVCFQVNVSLKDVIFKGKMGSLTGHTLQGDKVEGFRSSATIHT